tara:strand:+ start:84 stop:833 length:750 start_codon:yes stop_codon:yes gene_type:complete
MLDKIFKPKHLYELIRVGKNGDGGYLIEKKSLEDSKSLISFGISTDWSFEKDFYDLNPISIHAYDHTITKRFFYILIIKESLKIFIGQFKAGIKSILLYNNYLKFFTGDKIHFLEKIGTEKTSTSLDSVLSRKKNGQPFFLKIDIEGSEYRILDDLIKIQHLLSGIVIEFHDVDLHKERITKFIDNFSLVLVHIHPNNFSDLDKNNNPTSLEMTFAKSPTIIDINPKIPHDLDQANDIGSNEQTLEFYF